MSSLELPRGTLERSEKSSETLCAFERSAGIRVLVLPCKQGLF